MKANFKCIIKIVSPVHIGCGDLYEPMGFVVDENENCLVQFEPSEFIAGLEDLEKEQLSGICNEGNLISILKLYKFFQGKKAFGRKIGLSPGFLDHYRSCLRIPENNVHRVQQELNHFTIERTAFRPWDNRPYLPGSSIKGALRTGYLNHLCKGRNLHASSKTIEKQLMNYQKIDEDPFGRVQVSDFRPVGNVKTKIVYAVNEKKKISDKEARGPYQILEVIEPGAVFTGDISVMDAHAKSPVKNPVTLNSLINGAKDFYYKEHAREKEDLSKVNIPGVELPVMDTGFIPLRIGRHSGAESVTIAGNRNIKIMLGNRQNVYKDHSTTLWLASSWRKIKSTSALIPFGWSVIEPVSLEQEKKLTMEEDNYLSIFESSMKKRLQQKAMQILLQKEAIKKQEQKKIEKQKKIEQERTDAEQKKAELDAMSPEDRELAEIFDSGNVIENNVVELFNKLDDMEPDFKIKTAEKIKEYYKKIGKWKVNKKKKKQFAKVVKLKSILDEK